MKKRLYLLCLLLVLLLSQPLCALAEIPGPESFEGLSWDLLFEDTLHGGVIQSMCVTDQYIICIENIADDPTVADYVTAYYRNSTDAAGNPVTQYSIAMQKNDREWEHGNGMAYNPNTNEIYVALYTNTIPENQGCLYVMDPATLEYKRTIKVADGYNILAIDYIAETDQYLIMTNVDANYSYKLLNNNFELIGDLSECAGTAPGTNFQDCTVTGDYALSFPMTLGTGEGDFLCIYSMSQKQMLASVPLNFGFEYIGKDEPEDIATVGPGEFISIVNMYDHDDYSYHTARFYKTTTPFNYHVSVTAENGTVSSNEFTVLRGSDCSFDFTPDEKFRLASITVDDQPQELTEDMTNFSLTNVQANHRINVTFEKIPFPILKVILLSILTLFLIIVVFTLFRRIERSLRTKRRREARRKLREQTRLREERREQRLRKEMDELTEIEAIIERQTLKEQNPLNKAKAKEKAHAAHSAHHKSTDFRYDSRLHK